VRALAEHQQKKSSIHLVHFALLPLQLPHFIFPTLALTSSSRTLVSEHITARKNKIERSGPPLSLIPLSSAHSLAFTPSLCSIHRFSTSPTPIHTNQLNSGLLPSLQSGTRMSNLKKFELPEDEFLFTSESVNEGTFLASFRPNLFPFCHF
jgi:hypothetical protein